MAFEPSCSPCEAERYRQSVRDQFNPWARNAGKILSDAGTDVTGPNPGTGGISQADIDKQRRGTGTGPDLGSYASVANTAIQQIGETAREQMRQDSARAEREARERAEQAVRDQRLSEDLSTSRENVETRTGGSNSGGGGVLMLVAVAAIAAVATGVVKLPRGR